MNKKDKLESLRAKVFKGKKESLKMIKRANNGLKTFLEANKMTKEELKTFSKGIKPEKMTKKELDDFPGGTIVPDSKEMRWLKTLEECQGDLSDLPRNAVIAKVWHKIAEVTGDLREMPGETFK